MITVIEKDNSEKMYTKDELIDKITDRMTEISNLINNVSRKSDNIAFNDNDDIMYGRYCELEDMLKLIKK